MFGEPDFYVTVAFGAAWIAAGIVVPRFRWPAIAIGIVIYVLLLWRLPTEEAYPTTFYGSPTGFSAQSIAQGETLFAAHCASCHGPEARGDGPAGASLKTKPADLTADHVYEHTDGDLLWWITHGMTSGMPAFGDVLDEQARWNLIDFIRANADATRFRALAPERRRHFRRLIFPPDAGRLDDIARAAAPPDRAYRGRRPGSEEWLRQVADRDIADKLRTVVIASGPEAAKGMSLCVAREPETIRRFALYRGGAEPSKGRSFWSMPRATCDRCGARTTAQTGAMPIPWSVASKACEPPRACEDPPAHRAIPTPTDARGSCGHRRRKDG